MQQNIHTNNFNILSIVLKFDHFMFIACNHYMKSSNNNLMGSYIQKAIEEKFQNDVIVGLSKLDILTSLKKEKLAIPVNGFSTIIVILLFILLMIIHQI